MSLNGDVAVAAGKERKQLSLAYAARSCTALTRCRDVFRSDSLPFCTSVQLSHSRPSCSHVSHLFTGGLLVHLTASEAARLPEDANSSGVDSLVSQLCMPNCQQEVEQNGCWPLSIVLEMSCWQGPGVGVYFCDEAGFSPSCLLCSGQWPFICCLLL